MKGIYSITCKLDGKSYVGSAVDISKRWTQHKKELNCGSHHSKRLQIHWEKHGESNFEFKIIELIDDPKNLTLCMREQYWIDELDSYHNGYNSTPIAARPFTFTDEQRKQQEWQRNFDYRYGLEREAKYVKKIRNKPLIFSEDDQISWETENLSLLNDLQIRKNKLFNHLKIDKLLGWTVGISILACSFAVPVLILPAIYISFFIGAFISDRNKEKLNEVIEKIKLVSESSPKHLAEIAREENINLEKKKRQRGTKYKRGWKW